MRGVASISAPQAPRGLHRARRHRQTCASSWPENMHSRPASHPAECPTNAHRLCEEVERMGSGGQEGESGVAGRFLSPWGSAHDARTHLT